MLAKLRESQAPMHALLSLPAALVRKWDLSLLCFALQKSKIKNQKSKSKLDSGRSGTCRMELPCPDALIALEAHPYRVESCKSS